MTYSPQDASDAATAMAKHRGSEDGELGAALAVVGLSSERANREAMFRDDMIRVAHRSGASIRQLAEVSGLNRKTIAALVTPAPTPHQAT
jgi:hypothetical protein